MLDTANNPRFWLARQINQVLTYIPVGDAIGTQFKLNERLLPKPTGETKLRTIMGFDILVDPAKRSGFIDNDLYYLGSYEPGVLRFMQTACREHSVIIDVGANIGAITLYAAKLVPKGRVLAFEPLPEIMKDLVANVRLNNVNHVSLHQVALGSRATRAQIRPDLTERGSSSLLSYGSSGHEFGALVDIEIRTLDEFTNGLERVDLIKIDVEGYEAEVLRGATQTIARYRPDIVLEYDPESELRAALDRFVNELPYQKFSLSRGKHYRSKLIALDDLASLPTNKLSTLILRPSFSGS